MTHPFRFIFPVALMTVSVWAIAPDRLTPEQCNSYPFTPAHGQVTKADLKRELAELESVG